MLHHAVWVVFTFGCEIIHGVFHQLVDFRHHGHGIFREALGYDSRMLQQSTRPIVNHRGDGNQTPLTHRGAIIKHFLINIAHGDAINVKVTHGNLAHYPRLAIDQINYHAVLGQYDFFPLYPGSNRKFFIGTQVPPLAVHRHSILRPRRIIKKQQFTRISVPRGMYFGIASGNNGGANLRQHVNHTKDSFFIARYQ